MSLTSPDAAARRRRLYPGAAVAAVIAVGVTVAGLISGPDGGKDSKAPPGATGETIDPLAYRPALDADYEARATAGYSHVLYAKSPGGVFATARRVDRLRPLVDAATRDGNVDADTLEAVVFLESGGRADVIAGGKDPANASGLAQIVAETGQSLLAMHVDLQRSRALTRTARRATARGKPKAAQRALALRRRVDERFEPRKALAGAVRYLTAAQEHFGRDDLALVSYHMGIGNLDRVIAAYAGERPSYVRLFFDSTPLRHAAAWRLLSGFGDDSSTYYWRVLAAKEIMRLYRDDRGTLQRRDELQTNKASSEEILHPEQETKVFQAPDDVQKARDDGSLAALPTSPTRLGFRIDRRMGELAPKLDRKSELYRALSPEALRAAEWMGPLVERISGVTGPLTMTSAVRDQRYQDLLVEGNAEATSQYSLHTTGYAFDVLRRYRGRAQAVAFQFLLDRLQALNMIAWVREPAAIHITAASDAARLPAPAGP
jgi:Transglycosylase SLT domain